MLTNYHILIIKTLGATNTLPARVSIKSERFKQSITIGFNNYADSASPTLDTAMIWLDKNGFDVIGKGEGSDHFYIISTTFNPLKK